MDRVAQMIESDLAMSAKILQLVNSSFFGLPNHVTSPKHAASLLGLGIIRPLTLSASVFLQYEDVNLPGFCLDREIQHGLSVALAARQIAHCETNDMNMVDDTFIAGMMHDIGKLILAVHQKDSYQAAMELSNKKSQPLWRSELEVFGTTHAAIGAHLLGLWGLPNPIVEAVAFHHQPELAHNNTFSPLTAVHVADLLLSPGFSSENELFSGHSTEDPQNSTKGNYLSSIQLDGHLMRWRSAILPGAAS
jgi:HD-like signal output (HDOD) protein